MREKIIWIFREAFGYQDGTRVFFAPGRVNLIGEHTDYNGGHVLPCALTIGTYAVVKKREDNLIRFYSENFPKERVVVDIENIFYDEKHGWANYPKGVVKKMQEIGHDIYCGFDVAYFGNIPNGAGLSSSASIELVTAVMLKELYEIDADMMELVKIGQAAENEFVGVNCGIMDQFAIGMGKKDCAMLLNTSTMEYKYANLDLQDYQIIIANTNKRRGLADSKYNERHDECKTALKTLRSVFDIESLGDLTEEQFELEKDVIKDPVIAKRAKHAVYENRRTIKAYKSLCEGDIEKFGIYMNESHKSLKEDYEVTGLELDALSNLARMHTGAIGARMTGAGFGGCTVNIVRKDAVIDFIKFVGEEYSKIIGYQADFYVIEIGEGARELLD